MGPYLPIAPVSSKLYSLTAVVRGALSSKTAGGGLAGGGGGGNGGGDGGDGRCGGGGGGGEQKHKGSVWAAHAVGQHTTTFAIAALPSGPKAPSYRKEKDADPARGTSPDAIQFE